MSNSGVTSPAMVFTDDSSIDPHIYIIALEGHYSHGFMEYAGRKLQKFWKKIVW
jgi:hypothetical protein